MIDRPVGKNGASVNVLARDSAKNSGVVGADAMIAHHEVAAPRNCGSGVIADVRILRRNIRLGNLLPIDVDDAATNLDLLSRQGDDTFDKRLGAVQGIPEHYNIAAIDRLKAINEFIDEDALLVREERRHAGAFHLHRLIQKHDDYEGETDSDQQVAGPDADLMP